jgi:putative transposase
VSDADRGLYLAMLEEAASRFPCTVHAYVLMSNHVHLLMSPLEVAGPSLLMQNLGQRYVQAFNRRHARTGTLWEGRFRSCVVDSEEYLFRCHQYIEMNPVRAGMVANPREYAWSSHRANADGQQSRLITPHSFYLSLGADDDRRSARYRELFLQELSAEDLARIREATRRGGYLGSRDRSKESPLDAGERPVGSERGQSRVRAGSEQGLTPV